VESGVALDIATSAFAIPRGRLDVRDTWITLFLFKTVQMFLAAEKELAAGDGGRGAHRFGKVVN
jgi:hypothetical protein